MFISELLEQLDLFVRAGVNRACFRGQSSQWPLLPKAYRSEFAGDSGQHVHLAESRLLQWKAESLPYVEEFHGRSSWPWETLVRAQHFGLATRLLDWTSNPLVAAFFAVHGNPDHDAEIVVWQFEQGTYNNSPPPPDQAGDLTLFRPRHTFPRLKHQQALLSWHPTPSVVIPDHELTRIGIASHRKPAIQTELYRIGIDHESIFGTLDYLAAKINWLSRTISDGA